MGYTRGTLPYDVMRLVRQITLFACLRRGVFQIPENHWSDGAIP